MPPVIATCLFFIGIIGLFVLDRDRELHISKALCLPLVWLWLTSSRSLTEWMAALGFGSRGAIDRTSMYREGTPLDRNVLIGLMILAVLVLVRRRALGALVRVNVPIVLFLLYGAVSILWSDFPDVTLRRWFKAVGCLLLVMVVLSERDRDFAMRRLFVWAGFLLIPLSVLLIKYYPAIGKSMVIVNIGTWQLSPVGVTTHKNSLGGICQIYGIIFLWHFLAAYRDHQFPNRNRHLIAHGAGLTMVAWLFAQANSVTALSCFLLGAALLIAIGTRVLARKRWFVHLLVACLVAVPFATLFMGLSASALQGMGRDSTLTGRTEIWARVIALVDDPLIGTGFESFWLGDRLEAMHRYQLSLNEAHNGFVEFYISLGWIGLVFLVYLIFRGYGIVIDSYRRNPSMGSLRLALFVAVIVSSFTEAAFRTESMSWIAFLLITMVTPENQWRESIKKPSVCTGTSGESQFEALAVGSSSR